MQAFAPLSCRHCAVDSHSMADLDPMRRAYQAMLAAHHEDSDFADWLTTLVAAVATKVGGIDMLIAGRPGSWESARIREWLEAAGVDLPDMHWDVVADRLDGISP